MTSRWRRSGRIRVRATTSATSSARPRSASCPPDRFTKSLTGAPSELSGHSVAMRHASSTTQVPADGAARFPRPRRGSRRARAGLLGVLPSQQRFGADDPIVGEVDDRLEVQRELAAFEPAPQRRLGGEPGIAARWSASSKTCARSRPRVFASYMAASASRSRSPGVSVPVPTTTPTLTETCTWTFPTSTDHRRCVAAARRARPPVRGRRCLRRGSRTRRRRSVPPGRPARTGGPSRRATRRGPHLPRGGRGCR